jgi:hypothetical protein
MKRILFFSFFLLICTKNIPVRADSERMVGSIAGLAATISLDYFFNKTTCPSWEGWKLIWNSISWNEQDNWIGPTITLGWETIPELGGDDKLYYMNRFIAYYATYAATIAAWRYCKTNILPTYVKVSE